MAHMMTTRRMAAKSDENAAVDGAVGVKKTGLGLRARGGPLGNRTNIMQGGEEGNNNLMMLVKPPLKPNVGKKGGGDVNIVEPTSMQVDHDSEAVDDQPERKPPRKVSPPVRRVVPSSKNVSDIDARDASDPLSVTEYVEDIYTHLRQQEIEYRFYGDAMEKQPQVNDRMRAILVDWLVEVHLKFKLVPDTLYLTVSIIDKFLEVERVTRTELQLVGVTALLLASKYEEIYPPEIRDLVYITDRAYTKEQILQKEKDILVALKFRISMPTTYCFILRYLKAAHADKRIVQLSCYVAERMLQEQPMLSFLPSIIACSCIWVARKNLNRNPWSKTLEKYSHYTEEELQPCLQSIAAAVNNHTDLAAVYKKFASQKFGTVSTLPIQY
eukprot:10909_1